MSVYVGIGAHRNGSQIAVLGQEGTFWVTPAECLALR